MLWVRSRIYARPNHLVLRPIFARGGCTVTKDDPDAGLNYGVVIPTQGRSSMLRSALESVYSQSHPPAEVVVVIDGDSDDSEGMVRALFPDAHIIVHERALGAARSRHDGMRAITSDWICLLDDDDVWHTEKQRSFADYVKRNPTCKALRSGFWMFNEPGNASSFTSFRSEIESPGSRLRLEASVEDAVALNDLSYLDIEGRSVEALLRKNAGVSSTAMFKSELLPRVGTVPSSRTAQDWILWLRIATITEWHLVPGRWAFIRVHGAQITTDNSFPKWKHRMAAWNYAWVEVGWPLGYDRTAYAYDYAQEIHQWIWSAISSRRFSEAVEIWKTSCDFVESRALRASMLLPPPIRWRMRRYLRRLSSADSGVD